MNINFNKISNEKLELYEENGRYFLRLDFDYEDDIAYYRGHIKHIEFNFNLRSIKCSYDSFRRDIITVDLGIDGTELPILLDESGNFYTLEVVKYKTHELTLEEIEKKLGYKIKIVSEHKED